MSPQPQSFGTKRVLQLVFGAIALIVALALLAGGGAGLWGLGQRDGSGYFSTGTERIATPSYAFATDTIHMGPDVPGWFGRDFATVRIEATSARPVFVGIAKAADVERYLGNVRHREVTDFDTDPLRVKSHLVGGGGARPAPPASQRFWRVRASGSGTQTIKWPLEQGRWSVVAMNADGSPNVSLGLRLGARISALLWLAIGLLAAGTLLLLGGGWLVYLGARGPRGSAES